MERREAGKAQRLGAGLSGAGFFAEASNQIPLMKWSIISNAAGSKAKDILVLRFLTLPSMAMFPCVIGHFISEITDCKQQQKILPLTGPPQASAFSLPPGVPCRPPKPKLISALFLILPLLIDLFMII